MSLHRAPGRYWDFAVEYTAGLINHTAVQCLDWRMTYECLHGETPDISVFRFVFYEPIYYFDSGIKFLQANMLPGRFLGIARMTGDTFTLFIIISERGGQGTILHRSVIRKQKESETNKYADYLRTDKVGTETIEPQPQGEEIPRLDSNNDPDHDEKIPWHQVLLESNHEEIAIRTPSPKHIDPEDDSKKEIVDIGRGWIIPNPKHRHDI
jgi:hypothetical protein